MNGSTVVPSVHTYRLSARWEETRTTGGHNQRHAETQRYAASHSVLYLSHLPTLLRSESQTLPGPTTASTVSSILFDKTLLSFIYNLSRQLGQISVNIN